MYNRGAFKREAKQLMRASVPHFMLVGLVYFLLTSGLNYVVLWLTDAGGLLVGTLSVFLNILISLFAMVMAVGFANYALRLARREPTGIGSLFESFSYTGRSLGVNLMVALYTFLWTMLIMVGFVAVAVVLALLAENAPALAVTGIVVLYIAVIVLIYAVILRYAMASFALVDKPEAGVMDAIRRSIRMLRGYKGKLFVLELSFIGWDLLVGLIATIVMGIGFFVSGTSWILEAFATVGEDPWEIYSLVQELMSHLTLWAMLAEILCLPLSLWLLVYKQTARARFYNYVGGYDYHQYMNAQQAQSAPAQPLTQSAQVPAGGYYTPQPEVTQEPQTPQQPEAPAPAPNDYYTPVALPEEEAPAQEKAAPTEAPPEAPAGEAEAPEGEDAPAEETEVPAEE